MSRLPIQAVVQAALGELNSKRRHLNIVLFNPDGSVYEGGATGAPGPDGDKGPDGDRGPTGNKGPTGDKGATGDPGARGPDGYQGLDGNKGPDGDKGPVGDKGPDGDKGLTGDKGPTGDAGPAGAGALASIYAKNPNTLAIPAATAIVDYSQAMTVEFEPSSPASIIQIIHAAELTSDYANGASTTLVLWGHWNAEARKKISASSYVVGSAGGASGVWQPKGNQGIVAPVGGALAFAQAGVFKLLSGNPITLEVGGWKHGTIGSGSDSAAQVRNQEIWIFELAKSS
jgi:hypothetical protein